jgi:hypothetical protein
MRKRPNPDSEKNIKRIDTKPRAKKQTHGFQVHFVRGENVVTKMFSDSVHGGKEAARRAARKFKRSALGDLPARAPRRSARRSAKTVSRKGPRRRQSKPRR